MTQLGREPQGYQQVLYRLQRLRGQVLEQEYSLSELDRELDELRLSIAQHGYVDGVEGEQIGNLLSTFRTAILADVSH
ncbi:MAG: hypothetical protein V7752_18380 [Halopseudomonas sp.]